MQAIPESGFSPRDAEVILGLGYNTIYALMREGKIETFTSPAGQKRISRDEVIRYAHRQEKIREAMQI